MFYKVRPLSLFVPFLVPGGGMNLGAKAVSEQLALSQAGELKRAGATVRARRFDCLVTQLR
jgi:hypothetical protein